MRNDDDSVRLRHAQAGDLIAFEEFVREHHRRVCSVLSHLLDDPRDVDECAQDTFVRVWKTGARFRGDAAPTTWLHRIAVNVALQRHRRRILSTVPLEAVSDHELCSDPDRTSPEASVEQLELRRMLAACLRSLPFDQRAPVVLRDVMGWSTDEVASALGVSSASIKSRVHRARMRLRAALECWENGTPPR